ncbi:TadE family type IV pilus minor pilin [Actinotalea solisilvae]|uniref:TadE family type IV pilus minor pilin n=1 Tax=Actinotalea solisilvae TaxID=2072922 RepID=UPI0018F264F7|nr:TadE family type IV pilus minor pilin [Actinotalea solisilvae]
MTAELALALPAVVLVLAVLVVTASAASLQLRCADAARAGARLAAIGEDDAAVADVARRVAGAAVDVTVSRADPWVEVTVTASGPGAWFTGGGIDVAASATAWAEP